MQNIYEQIDTNKRRSFFIITFFVAFVLAVGYALTYVYGGDSSYLIFALAISFFGSFGSYYFSDKLALSIAGATQVTKKSHSTYISVVENLSRVAGIDTPRAYIIESKALNAFATGRDPAHAAVAITSGLLDKLNRTELEGVIAHEISHIKNYDTRLMTIVAILVGSITIALDWIWRMNTFSRSNDSDNDKGKNPILLIAGVILIILAPIIAQLIQLAISRRREFFADAQAVMLTRQPSGLIGALQKISQDTTPLEQATPATAPLYISNPVHDGAVERWLGGLFSTHPPVADRIKALESRS